MKLLDRLNGFLKHVGAVPESQEPILTQEINDKTFSIDEAIQLVQEQIFQSATIGTESKQSIISDAMAGDFEKASILKSYIYQLLVKNKIHFKTMDSNQAANQIYATLYGLGILQLYYEDKTIDEIRVNNKNHIFIVRKGIPKRIPECFTSEEDIEFVIKRMIMDDTGVSLDRSSPKIESVRKDGSRLTATCPPITRSWTFVLRKHDSFEPTLDNYIESNTLDKKVWDMLSILARGRSKILFSGNPGSGKTTLMKKLLGELNDKLRIMSIGKDLELKLQEAYPDKDIIEAEEQEHLGIRMKDLFHLSLRESMDALVVEEFRGAGEATEAVRACTRGIPHAMATAHFTSAEESVEGTAMFMLEEGLNLSLELAKLRIARAFNIVVQLFGDSETGHKKLVNITEISVNDQNEIIFNNLLKWVPSGDDYLGNGSWQIANDPSPKRLKEIVKSVKKEELLKLGWTVPDNILTMEDYSNCAR